MVQTEVVPNTCDSFSLIFHSPQSSRKDMGTGVSLRPINIAHQNIYIYSARQSSVAYLGMTISGEIFVIDCYIVALYHPLPNFKKCECLSF